MKAILYFPDYTFDISDINEDMEQSSAVNPVESNADFYIGVSSKSELKFSLNNLYQLISENSLANKEFLLQRGKPTEYNNVFDIYKKIRKPLFVQQGGFTLAGNDRAPYLSIYNSDLILQSAPAQPPQPVKSFFIVGNKLYCVHDKEPYLTAYAVSGGVLTLQPQVTLTDFYKNKLIGYGKNKRCFNKQGNTVIEYVSIYTDMKVSDVIAEKWEYKNFGYYTVTKAEKINDTKISVIAYDRMEKFEILADSFLDSITYPITLKSLLTKLCDFVGVSFKNITLLNENYSVPRNFKTEGVTCKQVLQWIAQITANFAYIDFDGNLNISWYTEMDSHISANNSTVIDIADYVVQPINKVQARAFESDIGVIVPIDERKPNVYIIENNPLLYATSDSQIRPAITNIYNAIKAFSYIPFTSKVRVLDENVRAGMIISATTIKGTKFNAYVMQSTLKGVKGLYAEYVATGNEYRKTQVDAVNQRISMLNGRTNTIIANIDEFSVTLDEVKDTGEQNTAQLKVQANQITAEVNRATAAEGQLSSEVTQTADSITAEVNRATAAEGELSSQILVQADQISLKVSQTDYNGNTIASLINQTATTIDIQASKINLTGYATFSNLTDGTTTISGSNIRTGIVSASRLEAKVLTTDNISAKDITVNGVFKAKGSTGSITIEDGLVKFQTSGWGNASSIYQEGSSVLRINAGTGFSSGDTGKIIITGTDGVEIKSIRDPIYISPKGGSYSSIVYIGSSPSNLSTLSAYRYYAQGKQGYTGSISYRKSETSSGTITVTGGIITNVS